MTDKELLEATDDIAGLMFEYYSKEEILKLRPHYVDIYDKVYRDALKKAMEMVRNSNRYP
jgi:hypothetical protein